MLHHQFPDLKWLKFQVERNFADKKGLEGRVLPQNGWPNVILNVEAANIYRDNIRGPLSIFANLSGDSIVEVHNRRVKVNDGFFFVTNPDQKYTLQIENQKASTFNIHFGEYFCEQVYQSLHSSPEQMLSEREFLTPFEKINFFNKLHHKSEEFNSIVNSMLKAKADPMLLEEHLFRLMVLLLKDHAGLIKSSGKIPVVKSSTREEVTKRLLLSVDYIYSSFDNDISLDTLASISCLSKFHYLRLFKLVFNKTPHQFISHVRTDRAKALLKTKGFDVSSVARSVGFKDQSSFSRMFFSQVGVYPSQYRRISNFCHITIY